LKKEVNDCLMDLGEWRKKRLERLCKFEEQSRKIDLAVGTFNASDGL
jgi:hypothetical protein